MVRKLHIAMGNKDALSTIEMDEDYFTVESSELE